MGIGAAVFLIVFGAVLAFALDWHIAELDLAVVGWIFMIAGVTWAAFTLYGRSRRRSARARSMVEEYRHPRTIARQDPTHRPASLIHTTAETEPRGERGRPDQR